MVKTMQIEGKDYDVAALSNEGRKTLTNYMHVKRQLQDAENMHAVLIKARNAYIADLKNQMIRGKTGIDLSTLLSD